MHSAGLRQERELRIYLGSPHLGALQDAILRYGRLKICVTRGAVSEGAQPALARLQERNLGLIYGMIRRVTSRKANYDQPQLRERLKRKIVAGSKGGKPRQWSARKAQLLAAEYKKAGGGYLKGQRSQPQKHLVQWTQEEWTTADRKPAIRPGGTRRYLPKQAWAKLSPGQMKSTNRKKVQASRKGKQFVPNTPAARRARRSAHRQAAT